MSRACSASSLRIGFALFFLSLAPSEKAWAQSVPAQNPQTTYVYFQRTSRHVGLSTPEVFQDVVSEIQAYLSANGVEWRTDGIAVTSGAELPLSAVQYMARGSGAAYLLYVVVDRPPTKWLKVTVECYDVSGQRIWQEEAAAGGGLTGGKAAQRTVRKLREELSGRLGQPGMRQAGLGQQPELAASEAQPAAVGGPEDTGETVHLANGTPVHLLLAESISSKTAQAKDAVTLQVLGDVKVGNLVVIANKARATATIESAKSAGRAWRKGSLLLRLGTVTLLDDEQQALRAWNAVKGKDTGAGVEWTNAVLQTYGFALLFLPFAPLQHGNQAVMPRGTVVEAVIDGDVRLQRGAIEAAQPKPAEPRHGPASVTFYYPDVGDGNAVGVWCGELKIGELKRGGKFTTTLPPGRYWIRPWNSKKSPTTALDVEEGNEEYVRVATTSQRTGLDENWQERFAVAPHDVGEAESADTTPAKSRRVLDVATLELAQLQSDPRVKKKK